MQSIVKQMTAAINWMRTSVQRISFSLMVESFFWRNQGNFSRVVKTPMCMNLIVK